MKHFLAMFACLFMFSMLQAQDHKHKSDTAKHDMHHKMTEKKNKKGAQPLGDSMLKIPGTLQQEHAAIHEALQKATQLTDKTGAAAKAAAAVLHPHFVKEEKYALPQLGLLPVLAAGKTTANMQAAIALSDQLKKELPQMLAEHQQIVAALKILREQASAENHPDVVRLVEDLVAHAKTEEEIMYPTAILIGDYLKLKLRKPAGK